MMKRENYNVLSFFIFLKKYVDFKRTICYIVLDT
nr:MAG TPA: hypothetical protein [Caudoviricetes sp.]